MHGCTRLASGVNVSAVLCIVMHMQCRYVSTMSFMLLDVTLLQSLLSVVETSLAQHTSSLHQWTGSQGHTLTSAQSHTVLKDCSSVWQGALCGIPGTGTSVTVSCPKCPRGWPVNTALHPPVMQGSHYQYLTFVHALGF